MRLSRTLKGGVATAASALLLTTGLTGCLSSSGGGKGGAGASGANSNTSKNVKMTVAFSGAQFDLFKAALTKYATSQGINLTMTSDSNFNADIVNKVKAGQIPDIAMFPQPGILLNFAKQGKVADLGKVLDLSTLKSQMVTGITDPGSTGGVTYGIPPSINVKSLVFYPKKAWAAQNLTPPTSLADLLTFSAKLKSQGKTPWCMGIESGTATGWAATDWIEQLVLNMYGTSTYNDWVSHKIKFTDPKIKAAAEYFQKIFATPGWVHGGQKSIAAASFGTAGNAMFDANNTESNPGCYMYKQGNFLTGAGFFPKQILAKTDENIGAFFFPGKTSNDHPVEGGGDLAALFSGKNQSAIKLMKFMLQKTFCETCAKAGGYISPFKAFDTSNYPDELTKQMAKIATSATSFAFDGSDAMPGAVGSGSFWKQMTSWINGSTSLDSALKAIDASWPTS